jgi:alpha-beta hydrolase superfamily lysophospholipase
MQYKKFILWGRSMGATSALLYCVEYNPQDVILQIVDSPFYSFAMIAFEIASKNVKAP